MPSITHGSDIVVNLSIAQISGWPSGLGLHRLRFSVGYTTPSRKERFVAHNFRAIVDVGRARNEWQRLGIAWPENAWHISTGEFTNSAAILFDLDLRGEQLALIERLRAGGDLVFKLRFLCDVDNGRNLDGGDVEVEAHLNKSGWI